ncbi:MAG: nucleotidyltransferase domain-containing protein [Candidatus Bathyarchaeota archaeon]|nr:nucleotidyltransferase domain-containing protein [Candidatus Bathyarchaeota archaeon]
MAKKPVARDERVEVIYSKERWELLKALRKQAIEIMEALEKAHIFSVVHGSIARGDATPKSDIDIFVPQTVSSFLIETSLLRNGFQISKRILIQATPTHTIKGFIEIDEQRHVSFPMSKLKRLGREFYRFGGEATVEMLRNGVRTPGVDKRLMLIEPTESGHIESRVVGREEYVAKLLGISVDTVLNRVRTLLRRDEIGRTGLFIERELSPNETFESVLKRLADENPAVRRRLRCS